MVRGKNSTEILTRLKTAEEKLMVAALDFKKRHNLKMSPEEIIQKIKSAVPKNSLIKPIENIPTASTDETEAAIRVYLRDKGEIISEEKVRRLTKIVDDENERDWENLLPKNGDKKLRVKLSRQPPKYDKKLVEALYKKILCLSGNQKMHNTRSRRKAGESTGEIGGDIDLLVAAIQWAVDFAHASYCVPPSDNPLKNDRRIVRPEGVLSITRRKL